ncbi:brevican core protein-like, partial [Amphibalanus amphitrite]|uniref:brevican core protein-like n=1 Tax=Amphibalanus amphitrite TaxID=1232801 RepID=UPI001C927667
PRPVLTGAAELAEPLTECPPGWAPRGTRCISAPTEPATRLMADVHCQQLGGRMATVRGAYTKPILALQLTTVTEVWVLDPEASEIQYQIYKQKLIEEDNPHLMLPGYSALTAAGKVVTRPAEQQLPAICEQCTQPCSPGAVPFAGHCYQLLAGELSLRTATDSCAALGAALVSVESMVENSFVAALAFNYSEPQCRSDASQVWLGLHRGSVSFDWQWQDCSEFGIQFWAPGAGRSGFCGSLDAAGRWWDSDRCAQLRRLAVCEWDPCRADSDGYYGGCQLPPGPVY